MLQAVLLMTASKGVELLTGRPALIFKSSSADNIVRQRTRTESKYNLGASFHSNRVCASAFVVTSSYAHVR